MTNQRLLLHEQIARQIEESLSILSVVNPPVRKLVIAGIRELFGTLRGVVPAPVEMAERLATVPQILRDQYEGGFVAELIEAVLDDLKSRPPDEEVVEVVYSKIQSGDDWRDQLGGKYKAVQGRVGGRDVVLSYPLTGLDAFRLQPILPPSMAVFKVVRH